MDLTAAQWRLTVEFGKLIFSAWNSAKILLPARGGVAYRDHDRFGIFVRKPGGRETTTLEFRELRAPAGVGRAAGRTGFRQQLTALLEREYRGWKFERVSNRSDREHSFSAWYTRGMATQGRSAWAFLGLGEEEGGRRRGRRAGLRPHLAGLAAQPGRPRGDYTIEAVSAARRRQRDCPSSRVSQPPRFERGDL